MKKSLKTGSTRAIWKITVLFQKKYEQKACFTKFVHQTLEAFDGSYRTAIVFCDLSNAFDNHNLLVGKLEKSGIKGESLKWFHSYLSVKKQRTHIFHKFSKYFSNWGKIACGVPFWDPCYLLFL